MCVMGELESESDGVTDSEHDELTDKVLVRYRYRYGYRCLISLNITHMISDKTGKVDPSVCR